MRGINRHKEFLDQVDWFFSKFGEVWPSSSCVMIGNKIVSIFPGRIFDSSKSRCGRQVMRNWISQNLSLIKEDWTTNTQSNDSIRVLLKKTFY